MKNNSYLHSLNWSLCACEFALYLSFFSTQSTFSPSTMEIESIWMDQKENTYL